MFQAKNLIENINILSGSFQNAEGVDISFKVEPEELEILADEKLISQVLINLVKNAFQANAENNKAQVVISSRTGENNRPEIRVTDNGPGIPPEILEKIFVPFFSTKAEGSGIGLSLSRQIIRNHGGQISVDSEAGKGTIFRVSLPVK